MVHRQHRVEEKRLGFLQSPAELREMIPVLLLHQHPDEQTDLLCAAAAVLIQLDSLSRTQAAGPDQQLQNPIHICDGLRQLLLDLLEQLFVLRIHRYRNTEALAEEFFAWNWKKQEAIFEEFPHTKLTFLSDRAVSHLCRFSVSGCPTEPVTLTWFRSCYKVWKSVRKSRRDSSESSEGRWAPPWLHNSHLPIKDEEREGEGGATTCQSNPINRMERDMGGSSTCHSNRLNEREIKRGAGFKTQLTWAFTVCIIMNNNSNDDNNYNNNKKKKIILHFNKEIQKQFLILNIKLCLQKSSVMWRHSLLI